MAQATYGEEVLEMMVRAVERVRERLRRATSALDAAGVPYAVCGGNAVAAWVATVDESAVRNTQDVDLLLRRADLDAAAAALAPHGFIRRHVKSIDMFLDGPNAKARDAVHIVFAGEKVKKDDIEVAPDVAEATEIASIRALKLESLVRMKLTAYRLKDRVHLQDMVEVGLIDESWCRRFPGELATRLREVIDHPEA